MKFVFTCSQVIINRDHAAVNGIMSTGDNLAPYSITFAGAIEEILAGFRPGDSFEVEFTKKQPEAPAPAVGAEK